MQAPREACGGHGGRGEKCLTRPRPACAATSFPQGPGSPQGGVKRHWCPPRALPYQEGTGRLILGGFEGVVPKKGPAAGKGERGKQLFPSSYAPPPAWQVRPPRRAFPPCPLWPFFPVSSRDFSCPGGRNPAQPNSSITSRFGQRPSRGMGPPRSQGGWGCAKAGDRSRATTPAAPGSGPSPHPEHFPAPASPTSPAAGSPPRGLLFIYYYFIISFFLKSYLPTWSWALRENSANSLIEGGRAAGTLPRARPQDGAPPSLPGLTGADRQTLAFPLTTHQGDGHRAAIGRGPLGRSPPGSAAGRAARPSRGLFLIAGSLAGRLCRGKGKDDAFPPSSAALSPGTRASPAPRCSPNPARPTRPGSEEGQGSLDLSFPLLAAVAASLLPPAAGSR